MMLTGIVLVMLPLWVFATNDKIQKRVLMHSDQDFIDALNNMSAKIAEQETRIKSLETELIQVKQSSGKGSTYVRWGRTVCPGNGTDLVYKGYAAGSVYTDYGGSADYICLPQDPVWGHYVDGNQGYPAYIYGTEYHFTRSDGGTQFFGQNIHDHDAPCAVCHSQRSVSLMIAARTTCYPGWTMEYHGYLVAGRNFDGSASNYACLDIHPETEAGDYENKNGRLMTFVEAVCGSLKCPPYVQGRELSCVVCSK